MATGASITRRQRLLSAANLLVAIVVSVVAATAIANVAAHNEAAKLRANVQETLNVQTEALAGLLDKYRLLPALLGQQSDVPAMFVRPRSLSLEQDAKRLALKVVGLSGAMDLMMIYPDGEVLATARGTQDVHLAPGSEPISAALQGRLGREMRILDNGKRVYVFVSGVRKDGVIVGVIAVYVDLEEIEGNWSLITNPILAANDMGIIVISNQFDWRMQSALDMQLLGSAQSSFKYDTPVLKTDVVESQFLKTSRALPLLGWTIIVLADSRPVELASTFWGSFAVLASAALAFGVQLIINRHYAVVRRERSDRATALHLERIVRDRTKQLSETNVSLEREIVVRTKADEQLRKAQNELIQTSKLAALGQMSTALSHEFNQPLSAVKSYADNALTFLKRGREAEAQDNIRHISDLTDRMAEISRHLRNFARKPSANFQTVPISVVIDDALKVLSSRIRADGAEIERVDLDEEIWVQGGHVRLQQVLVNLVMNALDAMQDKRVVKVHIITERSDGKIRIRVRDHGPGIDTEVFAQIFDPFFTTKEVGKGMGLGLSISYNIVKDFGGQLQGANIDDGGAEFIVSLNEGTRPQEAAQ